MQQVVAYGEGVLASARLISPPTIEYNRLIKYQHIHEPIELNRIGAARAAIATCRDVVAFREVIRRLVSATCHTTPYRESLAGPVYQIPVPTFGST